MHQLFKYYKILCLLIVVPLSVTAQNDIVDSLKNVLDHTKGVERFTPLYDLGYELAVSDPELAFTLEEEALQIGKQLGDSSKIVKALFAKAYILRKNSRLEDATQILLSILPIAERNQLRRETSAILNGLAINYSHMANYDKGLEYNYQALTYREKFGSPYDVAVTLNNLGFVYYKLANYDEALLFYKRSLQIKNSNNITYDLDRLYINIGMTYIRLGEFDSARMSIKNGFAACKDQCSKIIQLEGYFSLAEAYSMQETNSKPDYDSAIYYFNKSHTLAVDLNDKRWQIENLVGLAGLYIDTEEYNTAKQLLIQAEEIAQETEYNRLLMTIYKTYSKLYLESEDYELASRYQNKYIALNDSLLGSRLRNIVNAETNYRQRENVQRIAEKEDIIKKQQSLNLAIAVIAMLVASLSIVLYKSNQNKKKVNAELSKAKAIIEDQNRQLLNSNIHLDKELKERNVDLEKANQSLQKANHELDNFMYKTAHDIRGPLASLKGMCHVAILDVEDSLALSYLKKLDITAEKLNSILTRLLVVNQINNSSVALERIDFNNILGGIISFEKKKGIPPHMDIRIKVGEVDFYSDKEFIRIILENLIDNAIKFHTQSALTKPFVNIEIAVNEGMLKMSVIDNGIGIRKIQPDKVFQIFSRGTHRSETGGIGLYITKTAVEKLGGSIQFLTTAEGYTHFEVSFPLSTVPEIV